jgi:hypothetical protein
MLHTPLSLSLSVSLTYCENNNHDEQGERESQLSMTKIMNHIFEEMFETIAPNIMI